MAELRDTVVEVPGTQVGVRDTVVEVPGTQVGVRDTVVEVRDTVAEPVETSEGGC